MATLPNLPWFLRRLTFGACLAVALVSAAESDRTRSAQQLVQRLGHRDFHERTSAERQLLQLGYESYTAISHGTHSENAEIRTRSVRLLELLRRAAFADRRHQLRENPWMVPRQLAPGWEEFHALAGDSLDARNVYIQILNTESELMLRLDDPAWPLDFERRCGELQAFSQQRRISQLQPASIAALLFLACHPENQPSTAASAFLYSLLDDRQFRHAIEHSREKEILKGLVAEWIRRSENSSPMQRLSDAASFQLDAALQIARDTIRDRNQQQISSIHLENSVFYLALYGGLDVVEELEQLLQDDRRLRNGSRDAELDVEIRDIALVSLLHITGQEPSEYELHGLRKKTGYLYIGSSVRFASEESRQRALQKWERWRANHLGEPVRLPIDASFGELL